MINLPGKCWVISQPPQSCSHHVGQEWSCGFCTQGSQAKHFNSSQFPHLKKYITVGDFLWENCSAGLLKNYNLSLKELITFYWKRF